METNKHNEWWVKEIRECLFIAGLDKEDGWQQEEHPVIKFVICNHMDPCPRLLFEVRWKKEKKNMVGKGTTKVKSDCHLHYFHANQTDPKFHPELGRCLHLYM